MDTTARKWSLPSVISLAIPIVVTILIINVFFGLFPLPKLQGLSVMFPIFSSPLGIILGFIGLRKYKDKASLWGIIANGVLGVVPFAYWTLGVLIWGP